MTIDITRPRELLGKRESTGWPFPSDQALVKEIPALLSALESKEAEVQRLERACRVAVIALEHATQQEHGKIYEPAYQAVSDALYPVAALSGHTTNEGA